MLSDPVQSYLDALDEWGRALVALHTGAIDGVERDHHERMLHQSRSNLEITLRHMLAGPVPQPRRSQSVRMPAVEIPAEKDEKDRR